MYVVYMAHVISIDTYIVSNTCQHFLNYTSSIIIQYWSSNYKVTYLILIYHMFGVQQEQEHDFI